MFVFALVLITPVLFTNRVIFNGVLDMVTSAKYLISLAPYTDLENGDLRGIYLIHPGCEN